MLQCIVQCIVQLYPVVRTLLGGSFARLRENAAALASRVNELQDVWKNRFHPNNRIPHMVGTEPTKCIIDCMDCKIERNENKRIQKYFFNGKNHQHAVKFQVIVNNSGVPMWYTGPHVGTIFDLTVFKKYQPPLRRNEKILADKGYVGKDMRHRLVTPIKERVYCFLNTAAKEYNRMHKVYIVILFSIIE